MMTAMPKALIAPGFYWVKRADRPREDLIVAEWDGDSWYRCGSELPYDRDEFTEVERCQRPKQP